jgi:hypothetical protein
MDKTSDEMAAGELMAVDFFQSTVGYVSPLSNLNIKRVIKGVRIPVCPHKKKACKFYQFAGLFCE